MSGELDTITAPTLRATVAEAARAAAHSAAEVTTFLLDLEAVTFLDSAGLYALVDVRARISARGWALRFIPPAACGPRRLLALAADLSPVHAETFSPHLDGAGGQ